MLNRSNFETHEQYIEALRDYFAGQALVGFLSNPSASVNPNEGVASEDLLARSMYAIADAMLAARSEK